MSTSRFYKDGFNFSNPPPEPESVFDQFNSTMRWAVAGSLVSRVVMIIAIVAIVYAIIDCLKRAGTAIPMYARVANSDTDKASTPHSFSSDDVAVVIPPPAFPTIPNSQLEFATMERFLSNIAQEKPIRFSPEQLAGFTNNYSTILGSGGFGVVFKGELPNGVLVAVKTLSHNWDKKLEAQFMAEVGTIGRTYHINLVKLYGFCFDPAMRALVYEFMENGSLDSFLFGENQEKEWEKLHQVAIGTAKGLAYLHEECEQRIIHYDIKPGNILLDQNFNPKVADFGLAKLCNRENSHVTMTDCRGTPEYAAPELWKPFPVTFKCDVYSFGMLLFEIIGRRRNFDDNLGESRKWLPRWTWEMFENNELPIMISLHGIKEKNREEAERVCKVALWCIQYSPEARPLMSNVVKMLYGGMEISSPPNPFEQPDPPRPYLSSSAGSSGDISSSASSRKWNEQSHSKPMNATFEIEIVG